MNTTITNILNKAELIKKLKDKGISIKLVDWSCGCCGITTLEVVIDGGLYKSNNSHENMDCNINTDES